MVVGNEVGYPGFVHLNDGKGNFGEHNLRTFGSIREPARLVAEGDKFG